MQEMNKKLKTHKDLDVWRESMKLAKVVTIESKKTSGEQDLWDLLDNLTGTIDGPEDWSKEYDHYLYCTQITRHESER